MIIDTHVHIGKELDFNMPEEMVMESMDKYNIDFSLISNIESVEYDNDLKLIPAEFQKSQIETTLRSIELAKKYPDKIGVLPWIKPATELADEKFENMIIKNRKYIYGLKLHQFYSKTGCDDIKVEPYIKLAEKYNLAIAAHTGGCEEAGVIHMYNAALKHPKVKFVMVHMGLGTDNEEAISLLSKLPNLYGDTTWVPLESTIKAVKLCGSEKMLFGSDNPIDGVNTYLNNPKGERSLYQDYFYKLMDAVGKDAYENIMYKNAQKVFTNK